MERMNVGSVALKLGVSPFTVRLFIRERRIPFYRIGRRIVFDAREIEEWFSARRVPTENADENRTTSGRAPPGAVG